MSFYQNKETFLKSASEASYGEVFDTLRELQKILAKKWAEELPYTEALGRYFLNMDVKVHGTTNEVVKKELWSKIFLDNHKLSREMFLKVPGCNRPDFIDFYFELKKKKNMKNGKEVEDEE